MSAKCNWILDARSSEEHTLQFDVLYSKAFLIIWLPCRDPPPPPLTPLKITQGPLVKAYSPYMLQSRHILQLSPLSTTTVYTT